MRFLSKEEINRIRQMYPTGTRVQLIHMDDVQAPPPGTMGTVRGVDDTGSLLMRWDTGGRLNVILDEDEVEIVKED